MAEELNYRELWAEGEIEAGTLLDAIDDLRAQLPSQGGEAVAWRVTGRGGITVTAQYPEWAEADCLLTITPLYTHPADQAAEGVVVSRELLVRLLDEGRRAETWVAQDELRQLLAKGGGGKK